MLRLRIHAKERRARLASPSLSLRLTCHAMRLRYDASAKQPHSSTPPTTTTTPGLEKQHAPITAAHALSGNAARPLTHHSYPRIHRCPLRARHATMKLTPRERDHLLLHNAGSVAQKRLARGRRLNYPEAVALISTVILECVRHRRCLDLTNHS